MATKRKTKKTTAKKAVTRKTAKKKTVKKTKPAAKKKTTARKKAKPAVKKVAAVGKVKKAFTKSELFNTIADRTGLSKKDVGSVFDELSTVIEAHLKKGGAEEFKLPGMLKMKVKKTPARKARKGINPFTGEMTTFKAKPASRKVKITALKNLKELV